MYEGKAKKVFKTDDPKLLIVDYKDDATAFNGLKKGQIADKGIVNNQMSNIIFMIGSRSGSRRFRGRRASREIGRASCRERV